MKTLSISISEIEYKKFGLQKEQLAFSDYVDIVSRELARQALLRCVEIAERNGLSKLTMRDITNEVKAVRRNAKNYS